MGWKVSNGRRLPRALACAAAALALVVACAVVPVDAAGPGVGAYAPGIEATDIAGVPRTVTWGDKGSAATIVAFFDPQSPECLLELSFLDALHRRGRDFGLAVYAIEARGRQPAEVGRSLERYCSVYREPSFPVLPDPSFRVGRTYGVERIPVTFVTESHGVVLNRLEGYDHATAVVIARRLEQLLRRERGFFAPELREAGVTAAEEREAEARLVAAAAARQEAASQRRALGTGDRAPDLDFVDLAGRATRWSWGGEATPLLRVVAFLAGFSVTAVDELTWLDGLARRGRDVGLEALAVEAGGMDAAALGAALERYRRYNSEPSFPVVVDAGGRLAGAFGGLEQLPQTFLVARDGAIIHRAEGFGAEQAALMAAKVERVFTQAGRPFPAARDTVPAAGSAEPPPIDEEAPSIRKNREQDERHRSSIVQGDALFVAWEFERALPHYLAALEIQPKDPHALIRAAQILERIGDRRRALGMWERVLAVDPRHTEARERIEALGGGR